MKSADLHLHTLFSDGTFTPDELVREAVRRGISVIAVVDHDTVCGIAPVIESADREGIEVIPGIELTSEYDGLEVHILGYCIDYKNKGLLERLDVLKNNRIGRIYAMTDKLKAMGVGLEPKDVFDITAGGTVGRLHVARALFAKGYVTSISEAFQKYIGDKCPGYVGGFKLSPQEAIKLIKDVNGVPVLAHPYILNRDEAIAQFVEWGLMGLEVYYPEHTQSMRNFYLRMAQKYNLLATGGSDCHGNAKPEIKVGQVRIPYELVQKLKEAASATA